MITTFSMEDSDLGQNLLEKSVHRRKTKFGSDWSGNLENQGHSESKINSTNFFRVNHIQSKFRLYSGSNLFRDYFKEILTI